MTIQVFDTACDKVAFKTNKTSAKVVLHFRRVRQLYSFTNMTFILFGKQSKANIFDAECIYINISSTSSGFIPNCEFACTVPSTTGWALSCRQRYRTNIQYAAFLTTQSWTREFFGSAMAFVRASICKGRVSRPWVQKLQLRDGTSQVLWLRIQTQTP